MDWFPIFPLFALAALAIAAVLVAPLLLSWPQRVRWTVATQAMAHAGCGLGAYPPLDLREVVVSSVDARGNTLALGIHEVGRPRAATLPYVCPTPSDPEVVSMLREWAALHTPTLLYIDRAGVASLDGPVASISNLRRVRSGVNGSSEVDQCPDPDHAHVGTSDDARSRRTPPADPCSN
jgi:hypothetical protein